MPESAHAPNPPGMRSRLLDEAEVDFVKNNRMRGGDFEVVARGIPERARELIEAGRVATVPHG